MHSSFTWKSHQEKSGQYDVKAENVLVDISVNMFSCCRVMSLRLSVSARGKRLDHFLACVSWVKYNDIRVGFQHIVSNINRVIQTCSSAHHPTSPSVGKGLIYMATFKICHLRGDVTKTDVHFFKRTLVFGVFFLTWQPKESLSCLIEGTPSSKSSHAIVEKAATEENSGTPECIYELKVT